MAKSKIEQEVRSLVDISRFSDDIAYDLKFIYSDISIFNFGHIFFIIKFKFIRFNFD